MVHETIQDTFRPTNLTNESAGYLARREVAASTWIGTPRLVVNKSQSKQAVEVALGSAKLIQSVMS
jgi:hypothetical protein